MAGAVLVLTGVDDMYLVTKNMTFSNQPTTDAMLAAANLSLRPARVSDADFVVVDANNRGIGWAFKTQAAQIKFLKSRNVI